MTEAQARAFGVLSRMELVGTFARGRSLVVRLGDRLFRLWPNGTLTRLRG